MSIAPFSLADEVGGSAVQRSVAPFVSIIVPTYNEEPGIDILFAAIDGQMARLRLKYELIFVNDGSTDGTMARLSTLANQYDFVKVIEFSRNFGHQIAVTAGMDASTGDVVVIMDADMQDPPELIEEFLMKWREGYDVVYAVREQRTGESWFKLATAKLFYRILDRATDIQIPLDTGDFRLMNRNVVDCICDIHEKHRYLRGLVSWVGFKQTGVTYVRQPRYVGETKYPLRKMIKFALDGLTSFSHVPLKLATRLGFYSAVIGFVMMIVTLALKLFTHQTIQGWTSLMVVVLFMGGIQLMMLGVLGEYVGRIYDEVRDRPLYIIKNQRNMERGSKG